MNRLTRPAKPDASLSYVEQSWDALTDEQLLSVQWFTNDPMSLPNLQIVIPLDLGDFQIELAYELSSDDEPVPCAHCPQHQKHRNGFVLRDDQNRRYLLGSTCGPKAYGSDYRLASNARTRMKRRYDALVRWRTRSDNLPDQISALNDVSTSEAVKTLRRLRGAFGFHAPSTLARMRVVRPEGSQGVLRLTAVAHKRDLDAEQRINDQFLREVAELTDLQLSNKDFNRRRQEIVNRLGWGRQIVTTEEREFGSLRGAKWLLGSGDPTLVIADTVARLRGLYAIGRTTQDKRTPQIEKLSRQVDEEIWAATAAIRLVQDASEFFDEAHLTSLGDWLNAQREPPCSVSRFGGCIEIKEAGKPVLSIKASLNLPEFEFLSL